MFTKKSKIKTVVILTTALVLVSGFALATTKEKEPSSGGVQPVVSGQVKSWDISDDGLEYTFHLGKNVKFHNGK